MKIRSSKPLLSQAVAGILAAGALLHAGSASAISLTAAYEAALQNDPIFQSAVQDKAAGLEYKNIGRSTLLPQVSASYANSRNRADVTEPNILGAFVTSHPVYHSTGSNLSLRQALFSMDAWARYKQGIAQTQYSEAQFVLHGQELILRLIGAYTDALFTEDHLRLALAQRDMYLEQKKVNDHLFAKGEGTKTDMLETQARLDLAEAQVLEAQDNRETARAQLATVVGGEVTGLDELKPDFRVLPLPEGGFEELKKTAVAVNPDLVSQTYAIAAAKEEVNKSRAGHTPRVDFVAGYSRSNSETLTTRQQDSVNRTIGIQINIPIYQGGYVNAVSRQAVAALEKSKDDLQARTDKVTVELRKQYAAVVSGASRIAALEKAVVSGKLLLQATEQSIKGGVRINLDLLNAQQQLYVSQRDLSQAKYTYLLSLARLRAAAGTLGPDDVRDIGRYFQ